MLQFAVLKHGQQKQLTPPFSECLALLFLSIGLNQILLLLLSMTHDDPVYY